MALRAGYYGVKRFLSNKLETIAGTYDQTINSLFPRSEQAELGAKNVLPIRMDYIKSEFAPALFTDNTLNLYGVSLTFDVDDAGYVTKITGGEGNATQTVNVVLLPRTSPDGLVLSAGSYKANGTPTLPSGCFVRYFCTRGGEAVVLLDDVGNGGEFSTQNGDITGVLISVATGASINGKVFELMLRLASDKDANYVPYAMTNKELTDSAADQKTAINAIITAATGAADFAAFKTAMGAITPVTRSLSLTKEDLTEEVKEADPKKTVTKKRTTKKTEEE